MYSSNTSFTRSDNKILPIVYECEFFWLFTNSYIWSYIFILTTWYTLLVTIVIQGFNSYCVYYLNRNGFVYSSLLLFVAPPKFKDCNFFSIFLSYDKFYSFFFSIAQFNASLIVSITFLLGYLFPLNWLNIEILNKFPFFTAS